MKLTKPILVKLIKEEMSKISEQEEAGIGKAKGVSAGEFKKELTQQAKTASKEFGKITSAERSIFKQATDILKKYAQVDNLAAGQAITLLKRVLEPLNKVIKKKEPKEKPLPAKGAIPRTEMDQ